MNSPSLTLHQVFLLAKAKQMIGECHMQAPWHAKEAIQITFLPIGSNPHD
jgi:hypothetical protein